MRSRLAEVLRVPNQTGSYREYAKKSLVFSHYVDARLLERFVKLIIMKQSALFARLVITSFRIFLNG